MFMAQQPLEYSLLLLCVCVCVCACACAGLTLCYLQHREAQVVAELHHVEPAEEVADLRPWHVAIGVAHGEGDVHLLPLLTGLIERARAQRDVHHLRCARVRARNRTVSKGGPDPQTQFWVRV